MEPTINSYSMLTRAVNDGKVVQSQRRLLLGVSIVSNTRIIILGLIASCPLLRQRPNFMSTYGGVNACLAS